jgi:hypothetical protein
MSGVVIDEHVAFSDAGVSSNECLNQLLMDTALQLPPAILTEESVAKQAPVLIVPVILSVPSTQSGC